MNDNSPPIINQTINTIFGQNKKLLDNANSKFASSKKGAKKGDLALAVTVLLVELASSDQSFDPPEYQAIQSGLKQLFGATREEITALINQANLVLANLRGTSSFAETLRDNMSEQDKQTVLQVIDDVINADGKIDGYEIYLKTKVEKLLGVTQKTTDNDAP